MARTSGGLFMVTLASIVAGQGLSYASPQGQKPIVGQYEAYNTQVGPAQPPPYPFTITDAELPTSKGKPGPDDVLFQNLLAAEWYVSHFYNKAVEMFNASSFTDLGFPNTTYDRILEIRNNEIGHMQIMRDLITDASVKPGPCKYNLTFTSPMEFLAAQINLEQGGSAFLPGLVAQTATKEHQGVLTALTEVEIRHGTWALIDIWRSNPLSGPAETVYPYPLQILGGTSAFIIPGSCPKANPPFPNPPATAVPMTYNMMTSQGRPGQEIEFIFPAPQLQPQWKPGKKYYAVYFHALSNITVPFDTKTLKSRVPSQFDKGKGVIVVGIADQPGAPSKESVVAGPVLLLQQPDLSALMARAKGA